MILLLPLILSADCIEYSMQLFATRYDWEATATFYYHWYHLEGNTLGDQEMSYIRYTNWHGLNERPQFNRGELVRKPIIPFEVYKSQTARFYPDLIDNAQFICCLEKDDPNHELAGRVPHIGKLLTEIPYYDHEYALRHHHGYNRRFIKLLPTAEGEPLREENYFRERRIWRKQFNEHHAYYGEYYRWVHEYPNTPEYRIDMYDRPSYYPPEPHTIIKEPKGAYIQYFSYGVGFGSLFFVLAKSLFF